MPRHIRFTRSHAVLSIQRRLAERSFPRLQMALIVTITGAAGLLSSYLLLQAGVGTMALRYPLALLGAYAVFLFLLWLWLHTRIEDYADVPDLTHWVPSRSTGGGSKSVPEFSSGQGGDFGGGGASAAFDAPDVAEAVEIEALPTIGKSAGSALEADEFAIPLLAIALAIGLALASLYVVYIAPMLFAELLFDGVLSYTLYRHLRHVESSHWITTAFRRTALPFALTAVFLCAVGAAMAAYAPGARSIGEVVRHPGPVSR